eukprot:c11482_g1_i2.p1 GENE.c11482_g1_i2~~c11482_g1_i2.p1  ORF type:complete len:208 (+),score=44.95 c11482_g1_i2:203-826(+)
MEYLFKVLIIGEAGVGKTALIRRYVDNVFSFKYKATIGVDFALKTLELDSNTSVRLQLWDIAGQERFGIMTRVYYKEAAACVIVFDITERRTLDAAVKWKQDLDSKVYLPNGDPVPCILVANKCDLEPRPVPKEEITAFAKEHGFAGWYESSAKECINVDRAFKLLIYKVLNASPAAGPADAADDGAFRVDETQATAAPAEKKGCCK